MRISGMTCNGNIAPIGTGLDILLQWHYEGRFEGKRDQRQLAYEVILWKENAVVYDSGRVAGDEMSFRIPAEVLTKGTSYSWRVETEVGGQTVVSPMAVFETADSDIGMADWITAAAEAEKDPPSFRMEKTYTLPCAARKARAYLFGLGLFELRINGKRVTDAKLLPPNTRYEERCLYETFDITDSLIPGENCFTVVLGNGYNMDFNRYGWRYDQPKGIQALFVIERSDGQEERVFTNADWVTGPSHTGDNGLYAGETYDARPLTRESAPVLVMNEARPLGKLVPDEMPRVWEVNRISPVNSWTAPDGGTIFDFGVNLSGVTEISVTAAAGTTITIRHSEMINREGDLNYRTNRRAGATDRYICSGEGTENWSPRFTYHGFRYCKVYGVSECTAFSICALQLSAEESPLSEFSCSEPVINRIHENSVHSMRCNHYGIPTDCPVRDERTPCSMDSNMYNLSAMYAFRTAPSYYFKWLTDVSPVKEATGNPDWSGEIFMLADRLYELGGDIRPAEIYYDLMTRYLRYWIENGEEPGLWKKGFGDWCLPNENTWETYFGCVTSVNTSLMYHYFGIGRKFARLFGKNDDEEWMNEQMTRIRSKFVEICVREDGLIESGRQGEEAMPLRFGLLEGKIREKTASALAARVRQEKHFDTGAYGTMAIGEALSDNGYEEEFFSLLTQSGYPGYGWQIANGATSLWEQWAYDGNMHSHSHAFFAGVDASFYRVFCGIRTVKPGFSAVEIAPNLPEAMRFAECTVATVSGFYKVRAEKICGGFALALEIPVNTRALVRLPEKYCTPRYALFDGERLCPAAREMNLGSGSYSLRLVPIEYLDKQVF